MRNRAILASSEKQIKDLVYDETDSGDECFDGNIIEVKNGDLEVLFNYENKFIG